MVLACFGFGELWLLLASCAGVLAVWPLLLPLDFLKESVVILINALHFLRRIYFNPLVLLNLAYLQCFWRFWILYLLYFPVQILLIHQNCLED